MNRKTDISLRRRRIAARERRGRAVAASEGLKVEGLKVVEQRKSRCGSSFSASFDVGRACGVGRSESRREEEKPLWPLRLDDLPTFKRFKTPDKLSAIRLEEPYEVTVRKPSGIPRA
jgi:hypothetical protein